MAEFYLVARWSDGSVSHEAMQLDMRSNTPPKEPEWSLGRDGLWHRQPTPAAINSYLARVAAGRAQDGITLLGWRALDDVEHKMFERDRDYRNALEDVGGKIQHNMGKARELHRQRLRHINGDRLLRLDREWVTASARGRKQDADDVETKRRALLDLVDDPRIDAAQTIDDLKLIVPPPE